MRKGDTYTILYALAVCAVCSVVLALASSGLRELQHRNSELNRRMNVLKAFGEDVGKEQVGEVFESNIERIDLSEEFDNISEEMPLYLWREGGVATKYAFPVSGKGLWSTIKGYLALKADMETIHGITFYEHEETPGLGAEVEKAWFQEQFEGKKIRDGGDLAKLEVLKGKVEDKYPQGNLQAVDGISGATMTGKGVQKFLNEDIARYNAYLDEIARRK